MRKDNPITHVCICGSAYALLQYVLLQEEDIIKNHTYYILGSGIKSEIAHRLPYYTQFDTTPVSGVKKLRRVWYKLYLLCFSMFRFPFLRTARVYAQDYLYPIIAIQKRPYYMLQESPFHLMVNYGPDSHDYQRLRVHLNSCFGKLEQWMYGRVLLSFPGSTEQCKKILLTEENKSPLLEGKEYEVRSLQVLWNEATESKKKWIRALYDIADGELMTEPNIFLTQPLVDDGILTAAEYKELLEKIFAHYGKKDVCIKVHPRDTYPYATEFADMNVFSKPINLELLFLLEWKCSRVISICSTAVNYVSENTEVDWLGTEIHPKLLAYFGNAIVPYRKYHKVNLV